MVAYSAQFPCKMTKYISSYNRMHTLLINTIVLVPMPIIFNAKQNKIHLCLNFIQCLDKNYLQKNHNHYYRMPIIELVDSISRDERDVPLTQYITNA